MSVVEEGAGEKEVRSLSILPVTLKTYIKWKTVFRFGCARVICGALKNYAFLSPVPDCLNYSFWSQSSTVYMLILSR